MDWPIARPFHPSQKYSCPIFSVRIPSGTGRVLLQTYRTLDFWQLNAARLPVRIGHKQPLAGASPSPTETVGGIRPLPRPALTSPLAKTVPCLLSRGLMFLPVYRRLSCSCLSLLVPLGVAPSWALALRPPITLHLMFVWSLTYHFPRWSRSHRSQVTHKVLCPCLSVQYWF